VDSLELREFEQLSKPEVHVLVDELASAAPDAVERAVRFFCAESRGLWHGRGRALIARRLKHLPLPRAHRDHLVAVITDRLATGRFSEQFRDQLRLAMHLEPVKVLAVARKAKASDRDHIRRYAEWVLAHEKGPDG
jgi:hypothetical protein